MSGCDGPGNRNGIGHVISKSQFNMAISLLIMAIYIYHVCVCMLLICIFSSLSRRI